MQPFFTKAETQTHPTPITFEDLSGAFILLAIGLFASFLQFCFEMIGKYVDQKYSCA